MGLKEALDNLKFDNRMSEINLKQGWVTPEELKKNKDSLPDSKDLIAPVVTENDSTTQH